MSTITATASHQLSFNKRRVLLKRATQQINDPIVIKQKYKPKKTVQFSDNDDVRYFYKSHSPVQIHQEPPYMEYSVEDYQLVQPNWPARNHLFFNLNNENKIRMENIQLVDGDYNTMSNNQFVLEGRCRALNLSFEKTVHVRYTMDLWKSFHEEQAQFHETIQSTSHTWDRFYFKIPIEATSETKTIYMALRYTVDGQDYWDNNNGKNYEVIIKPNEEQQAKKKEDIKVLAKRYDFTASLSAAAARKPWSPPPSPPRTPTDDNMNTYTPPIFFHSGMMTPPTPTDEQPKKMIPSPTEPVKKIPSATEPIDINIMSSEGFQLSYTDFVNKYCFYNSHTTPIYSTFSTSPSAVLS